MVVRYPAPPRGPALDDPATRVALRRYQRRGWLLLLAGLALLILYVDGADIVQDPDLVPNWAAGLPSDLAGLLGVVLVLVSLPKLVKARRWRRLLSQHAWREVRCDYSERVITETTGLVSEGKTVQSSMRAELRIPDLAGPNGSKPLLLRLDVTSTKLRWLLRPWRQAQVAWLAGDLSTGNLLVVAPPGPGPLFGAHALGSTPAWLRWLRDRSVPVDSQWRPSDRGKADGGDQRPAAPP
jgi:hypothetical protein